jgi:uncharacterized membrane protein
MPLTSLGKSLSSFVNVPAASTTIHSLVAKLFQVLLLIGICIWLVKAKIEQKISEATLYFSAVLIGSALLLVLWTLLPQISIDYTVVRLFQQTLILTALPIALGLEFLFSFLGRWRIAVVALIVSLLFLDTSGFIPQSTGGYLPQLSLNNAGQYYDFFYEHSGEILSSSWLNDRSRTTDVYMDVSSSLSSVPFFTYEDPLAHETSRAYIYQGYVNVHDKTYRGFLSVGLGEYTYPSLTTNRSLLYVNQDSQVYGVQQ